MGGIRQAILAAGGLGIILSMAADTNAPADYQSIPNRNAFGIKETAPIQPLATNKPPAEPKKEELYLTGISTIGAPKRPKAYLVAKDSQKKDYDQKFYNLAVGERQGDVTLKEIDEKGRRVRIEYQGEDKWLSMKDNGVPAPAGPAPGVPGITGNPMPGQPMPPSQSPPPLPIANTAPTAQPLPLNYANANNRRIRTGTPSAGAAAVNATGYGNSALYPPPGAVLSTPAPLPSGAYNNPAPNSGYQTPPTDPDLLNQTPTVQNPQATGFQTNLPAPPVPQL
jgi:hypothetical protein